MCVFVIGSDPELLLQLESDFSESDKSTSPEWLPEECEDEGESKDIGESDDSGRKSFLV